jgi:hypothetical protein
VGKTTPVSSIVGFNPARSDELAADYEIKSSYLGI